MQKKAQTKTQKKHDDESQMATNARRSVTGSAATPAAATARGDAAAPHAAKTGEEQAPRCACTLEPPAHSNSAAVAGSRHHTPSATCAEEEPTDHSAFLNDEQSVTDVELYPTFDGMPLNQLLLRGVYSCGFEKPSAIQQRAIVPMIQGGDIIAQAQSGTGKTGAFSIALLQRIDCRHRYPQAIVLSPTRELADQTFGVIEGFSAYLGAADPSAPVVQMFVGGTAASADVKRLQLGAPVAVGTPGRLADLIRRGALRASKLKVIVLDEADEMLSQGFAEQVQEIFKYMPRDVQVALFSATMPREVLELSEKFMREPTRILVKASNLTLNGIKQFYVALDEEQKVDALIDLYESISIAQSVVFANTRRKVDWVSQRLNAENHTVAVLHSEMPRGDRGKVMAGFRSGSSRVLVTTDVVARGIDVQHVNIVINFDLPTSAETYLHRIGRSGRYGKKGVAINFVSHRDVHLLKAIEEHYKISIAELPMDFAAYLGEE